MSFLCSSCLKFYFWQSDISEPLNKIQCQRFKYDKYFCMKNNQKVILFFTQNWFSHIQLLSLNVSCTLYLCFPFMSERCFYHRWQNSINCDKIDSKFCIFSKSTARTFCRIFSVFIEHWWYTRFYAVLQRRTRVASPELYNNLSRIRTIRYLLQRKARWSELSG